VLANRWWQLTEIATRAQVVVFHQVIGTHACAAAEHKQAEQGGGRRFHGQVLESKACPTG
jgi:hypothetical protein